VWLYTQGLSENERALTGVRIITSLPEAIDESIKRHGDRRLAIIPEGPYVIPVYKEVASGPALIR
jgi:hypothetical protein